MVGAIVLSAVPLPTSSSGMPVPPDVARVFVVSGRLHGGPGIGQTVEMQVGLGTPAWTGHAGLPDPRYALGGASVDGRIVVVGGYNESSLVYYNRTDLFDPVSGTWTRVKDAPSNLGFPSVAAYGGRVYTFGGHNGAAFINSSFAYDISSDSWTSVAPMPTARDRAVAVVFQGKVWVLGGNSDPSTSLATVEIYDPSTDSWAAGPPLPQVRNSLSAAVLDGRIYVVGGHQNPGTYLNTVVAYDPASGWSTRASMPTARSELVTVAAGGALYAIAGQAGAGAVTPNVERYDPGSNSWSSAPSLPTGVTGPAAAVLVSAPSRLISRVFSVGGIFNENATASAQNVEMIPGAEGWTSRAPLPVARYQAAVVALGGKVYAIGGANHPPIYNRTDIYNPIRDAWTAGAPYPTGIETIAAVAHGGKIYTFGGLAGSTWPNASVTNGSYVYDPAADTWQALAPMPRASYAGAAVEFNDKIWLIGGGADLSCGSVLRDVYIYDPAMDSWSTGPSLPVGNPRAGFGAAVLGGRIYVVGGQGVPCSPPILDTLLVYDSSSGWSSLASLPTPRNHLAAVAAEGHLYAIGGFSGSTTSSAAVERYDPGSNSWAAVPSLPMGLGDLGAAVVVGIDESVGERAYGVWRTGSPMPAGRFYPATATVGDHVYAFGGYLDVAGSLFNASSFRYNVRSNSWTPLSPMPAAFGAASAAFYGGRIFVSGGYDGGSGRTSLFIYDITNDTWSAGAPMPSSRAGHIFLALGDRLYAFGGDFTPSPTYVAYDPLNNAWGSNGVLPTARGGGGGAVINGEAYLVAGQSSTGGPARVIQKFSPASGSFSNVTTLPYFFAQPFVAAVGSRIYVIGGHDPGPLPWDVTGLAQVFDVETGRWSFGPRLPVPRADGAAAAAGSFVVVMGGGGDNGSGPMSDVDLLSTDPLVRATGSTAKADTLAVIASGFNQPSGIDVDSQGNVYFSEDAGQTLKRILANSSTVQTVLTGQPYGLVGLSFDSSDNLWMTSYWDGRILRLASGASSTTTFTTLGGQGPRGIDVDLAGNLYVAHFNYGQILKIFPNGTSIVIANVPANDIESVAVDSAGNAYFDSQGSVWVVPSGQTGARLFVEDPNAARVYVDSEDNLFFGAEDFWVASTDRLALKMVPHGSQTAETVSYFKASDFPQRFAIHDGVVYNTFYTLGAVGKTVLAPRSDEIANLLLLDDNVADNAGNLSVSVRARDPASAEPFARSNVSGTNATLENERIKITGGAGSWSGGDIWRLTTLTDKVAGVTHNDSLGSQVMGPAAQNSGDTLFEYAANQDASTAWLFFHRITGGFEFNLTLSVRPGDPYLVLNGTLTNRNPTTQSAKLVTELATAVGGDFGDDQWYIPGAGPGTFTGLTGDVAHPTINAGYVALWDTNDAVGIGLIMSGVPSTVETSDQFNLCACSEGVQNLGPPVSFAANETKVFDTTRIFLFQGSGPEKTRELYYSLYPAGPGRFAHAWADGNSVGLENDVIALRGSPWGDPSFYWQWDHFNNKDAGVNQSGGSGRIHMNPFGYSSDLVTLSFVAVDLPDRSVVYANKTDGVGLVFNYTLTILPGKPYFTVRVVIHAPNGTLIPTNANDFMGNVGSDSFDDDYFVPGHGLYRFTGSAGDTYYNSPTDGYVAMWDQGERVGIGVMTGDASPFFSGYDNSCCTQGMRVGGTSAGDYAFGSGATEMTVMAYTGAGPGPVKEAYRNLYYDGVRLDARRHVANLSSVGAALTFAANETYRVSVTGAWRDGPASGPVRLLEYNRLLPGGIRTLFEGVEYTFSTGLAASTSRFALMDQEPSDNNGTLFVVATSSTGTVLRVSVDANANALNLSRYALSFRLGANELWDIQVSGEWSDAGVNLTQFWLSTPGAGGDLAVTFSPPPLPVVPQIYVSMSPTHRRGDLVTIAAAYTGVGSQLTFLVKDPQGGDLLLATAPVVLGVATISFRLANDATPGIYSVVVTAVDATGGGAFRVNIPGQVVIGVITVILTVPLGTSMSVNVTISNGALDPVTYLIAIQVYDGTRVPWRPILQTATVPAQADASVDVGVVIPATTPLGTYTMEVILLTDHPAVGGYSLDSRLMTFTVVQ